MYTGMHLIERVDVPDLSVCWQCCRDKACPYVLSYDGFSKYIHNMCGECIAGVDIEYNWYQMIVPRYGPPYIVYSLELLWAYPGTSMDAPRAQKI